MNNYIINPIWFYFASVIEKVGYLSIILSIVLGFLSLLLIACDVDMDYSFTESIKARKPLIISSFIFLIIFSLCPSETVFKEMMISSIITEENLEGTKNEIKYTIDYIFDKFNGNTKEE